MKKMLLLLILTATTAMGQYPIAYPLSYPLPMPHAMPGGSEVSPFWGLDFDGGDYTESAGLITGLSNKTTGSVGFWCRVPADNNQRTMIGISVTSGDYTILGFQFVFKKLFVALALDGAAMAGWRWQATDALVSGDWHHFVIAHNATEPTFFMDGAALPGAFAITGDKTMWWKTLINDATNTSDITYIGAFNLGSGVTEFFDQTITQVGFSSSVLTAVDAARIMVSNTAPDYDIASYRMTPGSGQTLADDSGNGYTHQLGSTSGVDANDPTWTESEWNLLSQTGPE